MVVASRVSVHGGGHAGPRFCRFVWPYGALWTANRDLYGDHARMFCNVRQSQPLMSWLVACFGFVVALTGCGSVATRTQTRPSGAAPATRTGASVPGVQPRLVVLGERVQPRRVEVMGVSGTVELRVEDPDAAAAAPLFVTLGRVVQREPRDVCFGTFTANESPENGDIGCQVRGPELLVLTLGDQFIPGLLPVENFPVLYGQAGAGVVTAQLIGPGGQRRSLPLSAHRVFVVAFSRVAHGAFRLSLRFANGTALQHSFQLPMTSREHGAWPRVRRRGAVFSYGIGENIVTKSLDQIMKQFGPPLRSYVRPNGVRCIYYDIVGHDRGWTFCFKGQAMTSAAGNQAAPTGAH